MSICKNRTWLKIIAVVLVCLFSINNVSWAFTEGVVTTDGTNLQVWYICERIVDEIGSEYNTPQLKIEMAFIYATILKNINRPFRNVNAIFDEWYDSHPGMKLDRVFNMYAPPTKDGDSVTLHLELFRGARKGEKYDVTLTGKSLSDIKDIKINKKDEGIAHCEAMALKKDNEHHSATSLKIVPHLGTIPINFTKQVYKSKKKLLGAVKLLGKKLETNNIAVEHRITIGSKPKVIKAIVDKELGLTRTDLMTIVVAALGRAGKHVKDLPDTLVITVLDRSSHLFEDHLANGFIGVNRAVLDIKDEAVRKALLKIGLEHEFTHEFSGKSGPVFEEEQFKLDVAVAYNLLKDDGQTSTNFALTLTPILDTNKFLDALIQAYADGPEVSLSVVPAAFGPVLVEPATVLPEVTVPVVPVIVGPYISNPDEVIQDFNKKREWLKKKAEEGDEHALEALGIIYSTLPENEQNELWSMVYDKASDSNSIGAFLALGHMFEFLNDGQKVDAIGVLTTKAEKLNNAAACAGLCIAYKSLGEKGKKKVLPWIKIKANHGSGYVLERIGYIYPSLSVDDKGLILTILKTRAVHGNYAAMQGLGDIYKYLSEGEKNDAFSILIMLNEKETLGALSALMRAYGALDPDKKGKAAKLLFNDSHILGVAELSYGYMHFTPSEQKEHYPRIKAGYHVSTTESLLALAPLYIKAVEQNKQKPTSAGMVAPSGPPAAIIATLIADLKSPDDKTKIAAIKKLGDLKAIASPAIFAPLMEVLLTDTSKEVRNAVEEALAKISPASTPAQPVKSANVGVEAYAIKKDSEFYSETLEIETPGSEALSKADLNEKLTEIGEKLRKNTNTKKVTCTPEDGKTISVYIDSRIFNLLDGTFGVIDLIREAAKRDGSDIKDYPDTLVVTVLKKARYLFEDHVVNGFVGINEAVLSIPNEAAQTAFFKLGMIHGFHHAVTRRAGPAFEKEQLMKDIEFANKLFLDNPDGFKEFMSIFKNITVGGEFATLMADHNLQMLSDPSVPLPFGTSGAKDPSSKPAPASDWLSTSLIEKVSKDKLDVSADAVLDLGHLLLTGEAKNEGKDAEAKILAVLEKAMKSKHSFIRALAKKILIESVGEKHAAIFGWISKGPVQAATIPAFSAATPEDPLPPSPRKGWLASIKGLAKKVFGKKETPAPAPAPSGGEETINSKVIKKFGDMIDDLMGEAVAGDEEKKNIALYILSMAYGGLDSAGKEIVLKAVTESAENGSLEAMGMLSKIYPHLSQTQRDTVLPLLFGEKASAEHDLDKEIAILHAVSSNFKYLSTQKAVGFYGRITKMINEPIDASVVLLGKIYPDLPSNWFDASLPSYVPSAWDDKDGIYEYLVKRARKKLDHRGIKALGYAFGGLTAAQQEEVFKILLPAGKMITPWHADALGNAYPHLTQDQKDTVFPILIKAAKHGGAEALRAVCQIFPSLEPDKQKQIFEEIIEKADEVTTDTRPTLAAIFSAVAQDLEKKSQAPLVGIPVLTATPAIYQSDVIIQDFETTYNSLKDKVWKDDAGSIAALGVAFGKLTEMQRKEVFDILHAKAPTLNPTAIVALGRAYSYATGPEREIVRTILQKAMENKDLAGAALIAYGHMYSELPVNECEEIYELLVQKAQEGNGGAIIGLGLASKSLDIPTWSGVANLLITAKTEEAYTAMGMLFRRVKTPAEREILRCVYEILASDAGMGSNGAIVGLGWAFHALGSSRKKKVYDILKEAYEFGGTKFQAAREALSLAYPHLTYDQQKEIYQSLRDGWDKHDSNGAIHEALCYKGVKDLLEPAVQPQKVMPQQAPDSPVIYKANEIIGSFKNDFLFLLNKAKIGNEYAIAALGEAYYALNPDQKKQVIDLLMQRYYEEGDKVALTALSHAYDDLVENEQEKLLPHLIKGEMINIKNWDNPLDIFYAFPFLEEPLQKDLYTRVIINVGRLFKHEKVDKDKIKEKDWWLLEAMGLMFGALESGKRKEIYNTLIAKAKEGNGYAYKGLGHAYKYLNDDRKKEAYSILAPEVVNASSWEAVCAMVHAYGFLTFEQQKYIYPFLEDRLGSKPKMSRRLKAILYRDVILIGTPSHPQKTLAPAVQQYCVSASSYEQIKLVIDAQFDQHGQDTEEVAKFLVGKLDDDSLAELILKAPTDKDHRVQDVAKFALAIKTGTPVFKVQQKSWQATPQVPQPDQMISPAAAAAFLQPASPALDPNDLITEEDVKAAEEARRKDMYPGEEFDPDTKEIADITYEIEEADEYPIPNEGIQNIMQTFDKFETLNFEVLTLLNKSNKNIDEFYRMLDAMKDMVKIYLVLFKDQEMTRSLESIAADPDDLVGGRTIAKVILRLDTELKKKLDELKPDKASQDPLPQAIEDMIQIFDGDKTTALIGKGAEGYSSDEMNGITFAELINVVHQKGVRNLSTLIQSASGEKQDVTVHVRKPGISPMKIEIGYFDARKDPDTITALPARYVAKAFAKGQSNHLQHRLFDPSKALVLSDDKRAIIGMRLGVHSARIQFSLTPIQEGGRVVINYTDSGAGYAPGSDIRIKALAEAFRAVGFKVHHSKYSMDAYFDKDSGATSIDELPEKLNFAIQALSSTRDLDLKINRGPLKKEPEQAVFDLSHWLITDGYLKRNGDSSAGVTGNSIGNQMPEEMLDDLRKKAALLGLDISRFESIYIGQRALDAIIERAHLLKDRGALLFVADTETDETGYARVPEYEEASKASPVAQFLERIEKADENEIKSMRQIAVVAKTIEGFAHRRLIGSVGSYQVEQLVLPLLGDQITFYVLKDPEDSTFHLAFAVLGEFFYDAPRRDSFRRKKMSNNELSVKDLEEILTPQNTTMSEAMKGLADTKVGINFKKIDENILNASVFSWGMTDYALDALAPFKLDRLSEKTHKSSGVSPISLGGVSASEGIAIGRAVLNGEGKKAEDFENGILLAAYTEPKDDPSIETSNGVVVTTGGVLSHAAIRSREHKKPALILIGAECTEDSLKFRRFKGTEQKAETELKGEKVTYYELSDYGEEDCVIQDGDLVYVDADNGVFYVIAVAGDVKIIEAFKSYQGWKKEVYGKENKQEQVEALKAILIKIQNENLLRALMNDVIHYSLVPSADLEGILTDIIKNQPKMKDLIIDFLREQADEAIEEFESRASEYKEIIAKTGDVEQVYLMIDDLANCVARLEHLIQLSNGNWNSDFTRETLKARMAELISLGRDWLRRYRDKLIERLRLLEVKDEGRSLMGLLRFSSHVNLAGLAFQGLSPVLFDKMSRLMSERRKEVEEKIGRGIIWKRDLKDRFARPIAGGKGAHSGEIIDALVILKKVGQLDVPVEVLNPEGFVIQPKEYWLWDAKGNPGELDEELKAALTVAYRDLVLRQLKSLKKFINSDDRSDEKVKESFLRLLSRLDKLGQIDDPDLIDSFIKLVVEDVLPITLAGFSEDQMSRSLRKRVEVFGAVAVRSSGVREDSAEEAMAGLKDTVLNVKGLDNLYEAVLTVWRSGAEGILIEEMINAKVSGVAFSADPVTKRTDHVRITAAYGLAKGLVDQIVKNPDSYVIRKALEEGKSKYEIVSSNIGTKEQMVALDLNNGSTITTSLHKDPAKAKVMQQEQVLGDKQIEMVAQVVDTLSKFFGFQVDVEFSIDSNDRLVILQVRPITTLDEPIQRGKKILLPEEGNEDAEEPAHAEAMELDKKSKFYSGLSRKEGEAVEIKSAKRARAWAEENLKDRSEYQVELLGRKINVIVENELDLTEGEIGAFLQEAMARSRGDINNLPDTFVFAILDSSSHLFEDHIRNGFIGINRSVIEIENEKTRKALLRIGLVHELSHEFTAQKGKSFEKRQLERDTDLAVEIFQGDDEGFKELAAELKNLLATTEFMEKTRIKKRKIERIVRRTHTANQGTLATAKRYLEKTLMESKAKGEEIPVDIVVDLSLLPQEKIEDSMETWSNLVLSCLEIDNVNFIFEVPEFKGKKNISFGLKKAIGKAAKSSEVLKLLVEKTMKNATSFGWCGNYVCQKIEGRINTARREGAIEIPIVSKAWLEEEKGDGIKLEDNQYPVAIDGVPEAGSEEGLLTTFEAAFTIALAKAALVTAKRKDDDELSRLKNRLSGKLKNLYSLFRDDVDDIDSETLDQMISSSSKTRIRLAVSLALPPVARMAYQQLRKIYDIEWRVRLAA